MVMGGVYSLVMKENLSQPAFELVLFSMVITFLPS